MRTVLHVFFHLFRNAPNRKPAVLSALYMRRYWCLPIKNCCVSIWQVLLNPVLNAKHWLVSKATLFMKTIFAFSVITTLALYCVCVSLCVCVRKSVICVCVCVCVCDLTVFSVFCLNRRSSCPQMPVRLWVDVYEVRSLPVSLVFYTTIQLHRSYCNSLHLRAAVRWLHPAFF